MQSRIPVHRHARRRKFLTALAIIFLSSLFLFAMGQSTDLAPAQSAPAASAGAFDPTRPEAQPPLEVDRDPIPSPDVSAPAAAETTPATAEASAPHAQVPASAPGRGPEIQKQQSGVYIMHTNVDEVLLNCTVLDDRGRPVTDLSTGDFRVWEDGVAQTINSVQHLDLPVSMGILIDNSGSMRDKRTAVNRAALELLNESNQQDQAFIVNFSDRAYLDQGFTTDRVALERGILRFDSAGTTALYDAVAASADELAKYAKDRRQVLLIVSDGADNASRLTLEQAIRRVQGLGGPVVYTIGLLFGTSPEEASRARNALEELSQETGGVAYFPNSLDDVSDIASYVARDIREQYVVDYRSSKPFALGGYRTVRVEAGTTRRGRLFVRTKKGYYAQTLGNAPQQQAEQ